MIKIPFTQGSKLKGSDKRRSDTNSKTIQCLINLISYIT